MSFVLTPARADAFGKPKRPRDEKVEEFYEAITQPDLKKLKKCLEDGMDANLTREDDFRMPLPVALKAKNTDAAEMLIEHGADINKPGDGGYVALNSAIVSGDAEVVKFALEKGANANANDQVLKQAIMRESTDALKMLLDAGANVDGKADARVKNVACGCPADAPIAFATEEGKVDAVKMLAAHGAALDAKDANGGSLLFSAAYIGSAELVEFFLGKNVDPNEKDAYGNVALDVLQFAEDNDAGLENANYPRVKELLIAAGGIETHA